MNRSPRFSWTVGIGAASLTIAVVAATVRTAPHHASAAPRPDTPSTRAATPALAAAIPPRATAPLTRPARSVRLANPAAAGMRTAPPLQTDAPGTLPAEAGTAISLDELQAMARAEGQSVVTVRHADGSESIDHQGHFADVEIVRFGPNGKPVVDCVQDEAAAKRVLSRHQPARPAFEEE